jgi:hypothetical protein
VSEVSGLWQGGGSVTFPDEMTRDRSKLKTPKDEALFDGEIEVDESYFGGNRKGRRGRGAAGKIPVFGLLKRGGTVYTKVISDASSATLFSVMAHKVVPDSIVYTDNWRG